ncbi:MAG: TonB-dependent receptor [Acidobacteria bacterium]|nr:TonB-dependent receptor [Acidobacteriota bacterium]
MNSRQLIVAMACLAPYVCQAQTSFSGTILGTVTDPSAAAAPAAHVAVTNTETNVKSAVDTDQFGNYFVPNLKPGRYSVAVEAPGFRRSVRDGIILEIDQQVRIDVQLVLGSTSETVEVRASAPTLQTESGSIGHMIDNRRVTDIPLVSRDAFELVELIPGVYGGGSTARVNGGRGGGNDILIDGIVAENSKGGATIYTPMVDALQEFKVLTASYSAEYGRTSGGVIIAAIKSGTNRFRGSMFEFLRNDALNTRNFFAPRGAPDPMLRRNQFGGTVGGPILRDKLFFFVDWEGTRLRQGNVQTSSVPTATMRAGDFSTGFKRIYDPATSSLDSAGKLTRTPFPGNRVPANRFDPVAVRILQYYPPPTAPGNINNFVSTEPARSRNDQGDIRLDYNISSAIQLMMRYSANNGRSEPGRRYPTDGNPGTYPADDWQQLGGFSYIHTLGPRMVNELRVGLSRDRRQITPGTLGADFAGKLGLAGVPPTVFPRFGIAGLTEIGNRQNGMQIRRTMYYQLVDNFTLIRGRHYLKFGFDFRRAQMNNFQPDNPSGTFGFGELQTGLLTGSSGVGLASFLLGYGSGASISPGVMSYLRFPTYDFYVQDDFKVSPRLTLNMGLRYEPSFSWREKYDRISWLDLDVGHIVFAGRDGQRRTNFPNDYMGLGPRFGAAYSLPQWKSVVRLGYGINFITAPTASNTGTVWLEAAYPWGATFQFPALARPTDWSYKLSQFPGMGRPLTLEQCQASIATCGNSSQVSYYDPNARMTYIQSWNFTVQRELRSNLALEVGYVGTKGTRLFTRRTRFNQLPAELLGPPEKFGGKNPQKRSFLPNYSNVGLLNFGSSSIYHSLQAKVEQRFSSGLDFTVAYTWSKNIDDCSATFGDSIQDRYNMRAERAATQGDQKHRLVGSYVYELPWGGAGAMNRIFGHWRIGGVTTLHGGAPITIGNTPDTTASNGGAQRPNRVGDGNLPRDQRTLQRFFDTAAFVAPAAYTFGNSGRGVVRGPGLVNFDAMLSKSIPVREAMAFTIRLEAFNLTNTPPFNAPNATRGSPRFGIISSAGNGRILQAAVKFKF